MLLWDEDKYDYGTVLFHSVMYNSVLSCQFLTVRNINLFSVLMLMWINKCFYSYLELTLFLKTARNSCDGLRTLMTVYSTSSFTKWLSLHGFLLFMLRGQNFFILLTYSMSWRSIILQVFQKWQNNLHKNVKWSL